MSCFRCLAHDHSRHNCPNRLRCHSCNRYGHSADNCRFPLHSMRLPILRSIYRDDLLPLGTTFSILLVILLLSQSPRGVLGVFGPLTSLTTMSRLIRTALCLPLCRLRLSSAVLVSLLEQSLVFTRLLWLFMFSRLRKPQLP